jgi:hypothetical protein
VSPAFAIPLMYRASTSAPKSGVVWMSSRGMLSTSDTASTTSPMTRSPTRSTMMTVNGVHSTSRMPSLALRSTTGMIVPRRFITPLMCGGVPGMGVMAE